MRHMDRVTLEEFLAEGLSLEEMGVRLDRHASTVGYWLTKYGLTAANRAKHAPRGPIARAQLERLVAANHSIRAIAGVVDRSPTVVRHWLKVYGLRTSLPIGRPANDEVQAALAAGLHVAVLNCARHGRTRFQRRRGHGYRCLKCRVEAVTRRRRRVKQLLVDEAGGACAACGYDECVAALHFHHIDPSQKRFMLSHRGVTRSLDKAREEARKCILLCSNCHAEVEAGVRTVPSNTAT